MRVKKTNGKIFGGAMSTAEKKALNLEIQRQLAKYDLKNMIEIDAIILWVLHEEFGFGAKRLRRYFDSFRVHFDDLIKRYEMDACDNIWLCTEMLKHIGVDIEKWHEEMG